MDYRSQVDCGNIMRPERTSVLVPLSTCFQILLSHHNVGSLFFQAAIAPYEKYFGGDEDDIRISLSGMEKGD